MADWLLIRLPRSSEQLPAWIIVNPRGAALSQPQNGPLSMAATQVAGRRICVLVPGADVLLTEPELPPKAGAKLQQIVPFALEEQLADDIDNLHFAVGKRPAGSTRTPVAVVTRQLIDEWLTALRAAGLEPETMYADSDLLPHNPGQAVALLEEDAVVLRPPAGSTITMPVDALAEALELAQPPADALPGSAGRGLVLYTGAPEWQQHSRVVEAVRDRFDGIKIQLLQDGPLALFAQQLPGTQAINLLQGAYISQTSSNAGWQAWRIAAILLASLFVLHVAGKSAQLVMLKRTEKTLDASINEAFHAAMPGEQSTVDARRRMEQRLLASRGGGGEGLLPAIGALIDARTSSPGATVQALSFREGALDLKMTAPDADSLDRISQALRASGWQADLLAGNAASSGYEGRLQIKPKG